MVAIEAFGPKMRTVLSVEESGVDPQAKSRLLDTDRVAHAQFVPDLREINGPSLKQEAVLRETTDTPGNLRQVGRHGIDESVELGAAPRLTNGSTTP